MKRSLLTIAVVLIAGFASWAAYGALATEAPENLTIDACMAKKSGVEFPHAAHVGVGECAVCHHTQEGLTAESEVEVESCASCHLDPAEAETPNCTEMSTKKNPYHIQCVGCHKESMEANADMALPVKCTECHPKEEG
jgi:hypothetical protein